MQVTHEGRHNKAQEMKLDGRATDAQIQDAGNWTSGDSNEQRTTYTHVKTGDALAK